MTMTQNQLVAAMAACVVVIMVCALFLGYSAYSKIETIEKQKDLITLQQRWIEDLKREAASKINASESFNIMDTTKLNVMWKDFQFQKSHINNTPSSIDTTKIDGIIYLNP